MRLRCRRVPVQIRIELGKSPRLGRAAVLALADCAVVQNGFRAGELVPFLEVPSWATPSPLPIAAGETQPIRALALLIRGVPGDGKRRRPRLAAGNGRARPSWASRPWVCWSAWA